MNVFYISYWGIGDGLSRSTSQPNIELLLSIDPSIRVHYFTIERGPVDESTEQQWSPPGCIHVPFRAFTHQAARLMLSTFNLLRFRRSLVSYAKSVRPDLIICRGSMAGDYGRWLSERTGARLAVESFEPHADYMVESGVWKSYGIPVRMQRRSEAKIKERAFRLYTVTESYRQRLLAKEGMSPALVSSVPCCIRQDRFEYDPEAGKHIRRQLGFPESSVVAIYTGKFGGIYYDSEAFRLFRACFDHFGEEFRLIILTPHSKEEVISKARKTSLPAEKMHIMNAPHHSVPSYLSASDFAISAIRPSPSRPYCSPIKDGEYWYCGLPILIPEMIGDDSDIVKSENAGGVFEIDDPASITLALNSIRQIIAETGHKSRIRAVGIRHRNIQQQESAYRRLLSDFHTIN